MSFTVADIMAINDPQIRKAKTEEQLKKVKSKYDVIHGHIRQLIINCDDFMDHPEYEPLVNKKSLIEIEKKKLENLLNEYNRVPGSPRDVASPIDNTAESHSVQGEADTFHSTLSGSSDTSVSRKVPSGEKESKPVAIPSFQFASDTSLVRIKSQDAGQSLQDRKPIVPKSNDSVETVWQCKKCDFVNSKEANICEYCNEGFREYGMIPDEVKSNQNAACPETLYSDSPDPERTGWSCEFCTTINSANARVCIMCDKTRVDATKPSQTWQCTACTYINDPLSFQCQMCGKSCETSEESHSWDCPKCTYKNPYTTAICDMCKIKNNLITVQPQKPKPAAFPIQGPSESEKLSEELKPVANTKPVSVVPLIASTSTPKLAAPESSEHEIVDDSDTSSHYESAEEDKPHSPDRQEEEMGWEDEIKKVSTVKPEFLASINFRQTLSKRVRDVYFSRVCDCQKYKPK